MKRKSRAIGKISKNFLIMFSFEKSNPIYMTRYVKFFMLVGLCNRKSYLFSGNGD